MPGGSNKEYSPKWGRWRIFNRERKTRYCYCRSFNAWKGWFNLVREYKSKYPHIQYIMLSQVSSKDMIAKAYENGIEFYISKPINAVEVKSILKK